MVYPTEALQVAYSLSPALYLESLRSPQMPIAYEWQARVLESRHPQRVINGARQSGKSTVIGGKPCHVARFEPESLSIVAGATMKQASEDMGKIRAFIGLDPTYPSLVNASQDELRMSNGSRIVVVPATETSARGYSKPRLIILDEASYMEDIVYTSGIRPMLVDNPDCELIVISTPNGQKGFFWRAVRSNEWERYEVRAPWDVVDWRIIEPELTEAEYQAQRALEGVMAWYSPRHTRRREQQQHLLEMGPQRYREAMLVEFVEAESQVYRFDHVNAAFDRGGRPLIFDEIPTRSDVPALEVWRR